YRPTPDLPSFPTRRSSDLVAHEPFVPLHVHYAGDDAVAERERGESQIDGDPAPFLLFPTVGVHAGQRLDQRGLAVVDVTGGADRSEEHTSELQSRFDLVCR